MIDRKKVLLIAFKFPPYAGVGSFRWSKISKYLAEMGYEIHAITVDWKNIGIDNLVEDVNNPNIIIHKISCFYPHNLKYIRFKNTKLGRFLHLARHGLLKFLEMIWFEDEAQHWGKHLIPYCERIIEKERICNVISTGAPFMANYWAAKLKVQKPNINLILDFRDPWSNDVRRHQIFKYLKKKSIKYEKFTVNHCDTIVSVTDQMLEGYLEKFVKRDIKGVVITNGHDIDPKINFEFDREFSFLYAGGLIWGREEPFKSFLKAVEEIERKIPEIKINVYGRIPLDIQGEFFNLFEKKIIEEHGKVSPEKIKQKISESFVCLQFNSECYPMSVSTKIYEYAALKRPTLSINYGGEIDRLIKGYNFGFSVNANDKEKIKAEIIRLYNIWKKNKRFEISPKNIEGFHYRNIAKEFEKYLI